MSEIPAFLKIIEESISQLPDEAKTPEIEQAFEAIKADPPCNQPWEHILVDQNGVVTVCCLNSWKLGNLENDSMENLWNSERMQQLREKFLNHDYTSCSIRCPFVLNRLKQGKTCKTAQ